MKIRIIHLITGIFLLAARLSPAANVTVTDNGSTVTMANGIVSIIITKANATINTINYTYNNGSGTQTQQVLSGGFDGGKLYWENAGFGSGSFSYSLVANNGNYAEVDLLSTSSTNGTMDIHFSMLPGSSGFYVTPIWSHRAQDSPMLDAEGRDNIYVGSIFNWMSVSPQHDFETGVNQPLVPAFESPQENELVTSGPMQGLYFDKYKYGMDFGGQSGGERVWGWSSVSDSNIGFSGKNVGMWHILSNVEMYNGGPLKTELMEGESAYTLNMINGSHYGLGQAFVLANAEVWSKTYGPYFIYFNNVANTVTDPVAASRALFADANAQAQTEVNAWPYAWFTNANYSSLANRGTVSGQFVINDSGNPNASASNLWVGVVQQPAVSDGVYDFQEWCKAYEFWTKTAADGSFVITNIIAGNNYTLYAFGPGANGTFMSQNQTGGNPPWLYNLPASPFSVNVTAGGTNNLGAIIWTPTRVGATVFEIGYPDRTSGKFRHGDDWFVGDIGPSPTAPSPIWTKFLDYPFDFPGGLNYTVGQSHWNTDWNFIQPIKVDFAGNENPSSSNIKFNLAIAPTNGATASLYLAFAADYSGPIIVTVNNNNLGNGNGNATGVTATPVTLLTVNGFTPPATASDVSVREGNHGAFSDERINFPASLLKAGANTININMRRGGYFADCAEYDYIRLEVTGYIPPAPASVTAYAGNNCDLICWPTTPGATSYNILRSTINGSGYVSITNNFVGPVCGSGPQNAIYLDSTAVNDTTYYYVVQSVNPTGTSANSPQNSGVAPSSGISTSVPATPIVVVTSTNNSVTLNWGAIAGANFYTVQRGTIVNLPTGYVPFYSTLSNAVTSASFTDASGTLGCTYSYIVTATSAEGTGSNSLAVTAKPVPPPPASAPANVKITSTFTSTNKSASVRWSPVSGAVGYILYRATATNGPFSFPNNYVMSMTTTNYTDAGLNLNTAYYYTVVAMNAGGVSTNSLVVGTPLAPPSSLSAVPGNLQVVLSWPAVAGATGYFLKRGTSSGNESTVVAGNYSGTSYTNTGLANGTTYYYVVATTNANGSSANSSEASATPGTTGGNGNSNLIWVGDGAANLWDTATANWQTNGVAAVFNNGSSVTFGDTGSNNVPVALSGTLQPALVTVNAAQNYIFGGIGILSGTNALLKLNTGALTLSATNTYTGGTTVNGGSLIFSYGAAIPASGTLTLNNTGAVTVASASTLPNVLVNGNNSITGNGNSGTGVKILDVEGALTLFVTGGSDVFDLTGTMTGGGTLTLGSAPMSLRFNGTGGDANAIFNFGSSNALAYVRNSATAIALGGLSGDANTALYGNNSGGVNVTYTIGAANANTEFDGVIANGSVGTSALVKTGAGILTLAGANTYGGGTTVNGGTLQINNSTGSGTGDGAVIIANSGTLSGEGIISGTTTVNSGGTLAPGNQDLGALTFVNSLTLNSGSKIILSVSHDSQTNNAVIVNNTFALNGSLIVSNADVPLQAGDSFQLFSAGNVSGNFSSVTLPALTSGLYWITNALVTGGKVSVRMETPPIIGNINFISGQLILSGTGGLTNGTYYVLTSTNLATPVTNWTRLLTNQFDGNGNFIFTNLVNPVSSKTFYLLQLP